MKPFFQLLVALFVFNSAFAQLGNECGIPQWDAAKAYSSNSHVNYNSQVYFNVNWSQNQQPDINENWTALGVCDEQLLIDNPDLAYTNCANVNSWDSATANYDTDDLVGYSNGVYRAKYWVAGTEQPDVSDAYEFLGICVVPIEIMPTYQNNEVVIQSTLENIQLSAAINTFGFSVIENKIRIKETNEVNFDEYAMNLANNVISYDWLPVSYGDYDLQYVSVNSVGVESVVDRLIKIAASTPPNVILNSPEDTSSFIQLNFSSIPISFNVEATDQSIQNIVVKDNTSNTTSSIVVSSAEEYTFNWQPQAYGVNNLEIQATDNIGTTQLMTFSYVIVDPTTEGLLFEELPHQIKAVHNIQKDFIFNKEIVGVKSRNLPLTAFSFNNTTLTVGSDNPGRSGLEITTSDGERYHIGLRIDNSDGSVPKYPTHVAIGSVSEDIDDDVNFFNDGINNDNLLLNNRMDVRYIYINGGPLIGWNTWQPDRAIKFAKNSLKMGLIPFFIFYNIPDGGESYTTNLEHIQDPDYMTAYFENLDLFLNQVKEEVGDEFFGIILEPDFLGYMQQNSEPSTLSTSVSQNSIGENEGTLKTLVERINFEINKKRIDDNLNFEFGWQLNLWAKPNVAGLRGIIRETDTGEFNTQLQKIKQTASDIYEYGNIMGIMSSNADFVSIDKYGLDAMGAPSNSDPADPSTYTWFWNNDHWKNYLAFVKQLFEDSGVHVILWQITVGHINGTTTINEYTGTDFVPFNNTSKHYEDSASNFFFGETTDFSDDLVRFNYFSENMHGDTKMVVDNATKHVTWGNHFEEVNESGVKLVLMGAGVGDSTDGIGDPEDPGATLTDDHFWIQKVQDYYLNHLTISTTDETLDVTDFVLEDNGKDFNVSLMGNSLIVRSLAHGQKDIDVFLYDIQGKLILRRNDNSIDSRGKLKLGTPKMSESVFICIIRDSNSLSSYKIINK